ncbi:MAG: hypothetical protein IJ916_01230 [Paludibacteraceae bacterium]|nr:hypothetical protein [Paludibacteraceae bacterium]
MKITNNVLFNVLCALALCVISSCLGYFFRSIQNNCILEDSDCPDHTQSCIYDENVNQDYTILNTFCGRILPENFIESRCVSGKVRGSADTILADMFEKFLMMSDVREINIWEYQMDDAVGSYHIEYLHDSLWLSSDKDTIYIPSSWWISLANEVKHTPTDSISINRMNIQDRDIQRFDSLLNKFPSVYYSDSSLSATNVVEKMRKMSLPARSVPLGKYLEIVFIDSYGENFIAVNNSDIDPNGYIWTFSFKGFYFRYYGLAFQKLIRNCISPDSPLYHKLEKEMMLLNLNATCWGEDVKYMLHE